MISIESLLSHVLEPICHEEIGLWKDDGTQSDLAIINKTTQDWTASRTGTLKSILNVMYNRTM